MIRIVVAVVSLLFHALPALAAVPPLSDAERVRRADTVVVGTIVAIYSRTVEHSHGADREYVAIVRVDAVEKGEARGAGSPLYVHFAKPEPRSPAVVGSQRQGRVPSEGQRLRLFAQRDRDGLTFLLEPNGWDAVPAGASSSEAKGREDFSSR